MNKISSGLLYKILKGITSSITSQVILLNILERKLSIGPTKQMDDFNDISFSVKQLKCYLVPQLEGHFKIAP